MKYEDITASEFEKSVRSAFRYLETDRGMKPVPLEARQPDWPLDRNVTVLYQGEGYSVEVAWTIADHLIDVRIYRPFADRMPDRRPVQLEPFAEFSQEGVKPILERYYLNSSHKAALLAMRRRRKRFEGPLSEIVDALAQRLKEYLDPILGASRSEIERYQDWIVNHAGKE